MNISDRKYLDYVLKADLMMNRGKFQLSLREKIRNFIYRDYIIEYLKALRHVEFTRGGVTKYWWQFKYRELGAKLGFSIAPGVLGAGVVIPHYGTIVVGAGNKVGDFAVFIVK